MSQHGRARAGMDWMPALLTAKGMYPRLLVILPKKRWVYTGIPHTGSLLIVQQPHVLHSQVILHSPFGLSLLDIDLDTDLDLVTANGHVLTHISRIQEAIKFKQPPQIYLNRGDGVFDEFLSNEEPFSTEMVARGLTYADYDRDGDLDVLFVENDGPARLCRNDTQTGGYLRVKLEGTESNHDAVGAHVIAVVPDLRMERWVKTGSSFLSTYEKTLTFGLGNNQRVDSLLISWPSGKQEVLLNIEANQEILVREGEGQYSMLSGK